MANLLQQLQSDEAVLLMYLADELPETERAEVEKRLSDSQELRDKLAELAAAQETVFSAMKKLDAQTAMPLAQPAAVRQAVRAMHQWQIDRFARPAEEKRRWGLRYPWWIYPSASAAAILIAWLVWWGNRPDVPGIYAGRALINLSDDPAQQAQVVERLRQSFDPPDSVRSLLSAEGDALALSAPDSGSEINEELNQ
jgi:hypothetical protein